MAKYLYVLILLFAFSLFAQEECTIGVASGRVTSDGRPLIWKTRDNSDARDNELVYNTSYSIPFLEIVTEGKTYAWMGVNEQGFAILNSLANDLPIGDTGYSNGSLMRAALGKCTDIASFQQFLDVKDHGKTHGNFAVLDAGGAVALYEISGTSYWKFDLQDTLTFPDGYIIRTNFATNGTQGGGSGFERYTRSSNIMQELHSGDSLNYKNILRIQMRDFSDYDSNPVAVPFPDKWYSYRPYGYIYTNVSINRWSSVSATVIQGVLAGESALLSTMWTMLGSPAASVAVPYWPVGETPENANGSSSAPLCDISLDIRSKLFDYADSKYYIDSYKLLDGDGGGLWADLFPVEDSILVVGEKWLNQWRTNGVNVSEMLDVEQTYAEYAYTSLQQAYTNLVTGISTTAPKIAHSFKLKQNYPNPFNPTTVISYRLSESGKVNLSIYNILGQRVAVLVSEKQSAGAYQINWNAANNKLPSGIYFCRLNLQTADAVSMDYIKLNYIK